MQRAHLVLGACAVAIAGAATGASINTNPLDRGLDAWDHLLRHEVPAASLEQFARMAAPVDQYAIVTPRGRFEVAELRDRGLYSQHRFGASWSEPEHVEPPYEIAAADYRYVEDASSPFEQPPAEDFDAGDLSKGAAPLALAQPATLTVRPRSIDVAAALASRE